MNGGKAKKQRKTFHHSTTGKTLSNQERLNMIKISSQAFHVCLLRQWEKEEEEANFFHLASQPTQNHFARENLQGFISTFLGGKSFNEDER